MDEPSQAFAARVVARLRPHLPALRGLGATVDRERLAAGLGAFCAALADVNRRVNLTGITAPEAMASRHVLDSLLACRLLDGSGPVVDLGSGGGVPGIPLALALPHRPVVLVESRARKATALTELVQRLGLGDRVRVVHARGEDWLATHVVDTVVTRAVGSVTAQLRLLSGVRPAFRRLIMFKGPAADDELSDARPRMGRWGFVEPARIEEELPERDGRRVLLVFSGAAET